MNLPNMIEAKKRDKNANIENYVYEEIRIDDSLKGKKYYVRTYGCQMNEHDGERIKLCSDLPSLWLFLQQRQETYTSTQQAPGFMLPFTQTFLGGR